MNFKQYFAALLVAVLLAVAPTALAQKSYEKVTWEELQSRPYPNGLNDAKLGIFIHWGLYSVPS